MNNHEYTGDLVATNRILYTPSDFARETLLHIQEIGSLKALQPHISKRSNLDSYLFFYVSEGSGNLNYNGTNYSLKQGECVFLDCNGSYFHETKQNLWTLHWIHFSGPAMRGIYEKYRQRGGLPVLRPKSLSRYEKLWEELFSLASSEDYIRDMRMNEKLSALLTRIMEESWNPAAQIRSEKKNQLSAIHTYLQGHFTEHILLDELANSFYINKYYMERIFKEQFGVPINQYLLQLRITKAKQMLRFTDNSIEEIGFACGIGAPQYFSRTFRKIEGISPSEYRKQW